MIGIPRYVGAAPLLLLGVSGAVVGRRWREALVVVGLVGLSLWFSVFNLSPWGSNP